MLANIMSRCAAFLPRLIVAVFLALLVVPRLIVVALVVFLVVSPALAGQPQPAAQDGSDTALPAAPQRDEAAGISGPVTPQANRAAPDNSVMTRWTVDSGGELAATGGDFELSGTIGQPDVGIASGDDLTLVGGFWFPLDNGDCNTDGCVDLIDFDGFQPCFSGPADVVGRGCRCFDVDQDGDVDLTDVAAFQHAFTGG